MEIRYDDFTYISNTEWKKQLNLQNFQLALTYSGNSISSFIQQKNIYIYLCYVCPLLMVLSFNTYKK